MSLLRTRWSAIGAAVAITLGAGGVGLSNAAISSGPKPVFVAITPCRLVDTRPGSDNVGGRTAPLGAADTLTLQVTGSTGECTGIPAGATAAAMNVTAIQGSAWSFLTVYPADAGLPKASNLNWVAGAPPTPNKVDVDLSPTGQVKLTNAFGTVHVAVDLVGYYVDHTHDDRYYTEPEANSLATRIGLATGMADFTPVIGGNVADDVATLTISAPTDRAMLSLVTATVHVSTSGDQQSTWSLAVSSGGGPAVVATTRRMSVVTPSASGDNPSETIVLNTVVPLAAGTTHVVTVSGERVAGVPLANIRVEIASVSSPFDATGAPPA